MTDIVPHSYVQSGSPFDAIRDFDENGNEVWSARKLMPILGYDRWEFFAGVNIVRNGKHRVSVIEKAMISCRVSGDSAENNFRRVTKEGKGGGYDWVLSRKACYLIAMCGDPSKPEIAAAQAYFAIKTREAEVVIPTLNQENETLRLKIRAMELEKELIDKRHWVTTSMPEYQQQKVLGFEVVEKVRVEEKVYREEELIRDGSTMSKAAICYRLGILNKNGKPDYPRIDKLIAAQQFPPEAWQLTAFIKENQELRTEYFKQLERAWDDQRGQRYLGE